MSVRVYFLVIKKTCFVLPPDREGGTIKMGINLHF